MPTDSDTNVRLNQLDGLRGLAALAVFFFHSFELVALQPNARDVAVWPVLRVIWDGSAAVILFFVLSGFVLTLPYAGESPKKIDTLPFIIRRITRLYPAYWVALLLALLLRFFVFSPQGLYGLNPWINSLWHLPVSPLSVFKHFLMLAPSLRTDEIDPVIWSLVAEMKVSLIFPAVLVLIQKTKKPWMAFLAIGIALICDAYLHIFAHLTIFLLGAYLAKYRSSIAAILGSSAWLRMGLAVCAYVLYGAPTVLPMLRDPYLEIAIAVGACMWIALFLCDGLPQKIGKWRPVLFLGNVSYSFYLTHLPILLTVTSCLYPRTSSVWICVATSLACSLSLSYAIYKLVEIPAQNWGRKQAKAVDRRITAFTAMQKTTVP